MQLEATRECKAVCQEPIDIPQGSHFGKALAFLFASFLTEPVCQVRECWWKLALVDSLHPDALPIVNIARKLILVGKTGGWALLALATTFPGMGLRGLTARLQKEPYIRLTNPKVTDQTLPADGKFTLFFWNVCCVAGGYCITDGGVAPWKDRLQGIVTTIKDKDADVVCLAETFDTTAAFTIAVELQKQGYKNIYWNNGPRVVGPCAGLLVASKYEVRHPKFTAFPESSLVGRTKNATKGVFQFDLCSQDRPFALIQATHLQHSEIPEAATQEERDGRKAQMDIIAKVANSVRDLVSVVTGDLNLDDAEYAQSDWAQHFTRGELGMGSQCSWGGDAFCASLMQKQVSGALNLDYTMVVNGTGDLKTTLVKTGYDAAKFKADALSDHLGVFSEITVISQG